MLTRTDAIQAVLSQDAHSDLAARYNGGMEVQVFVAQGNGEPAFESVSKPKPGTYINDRNEEWYHFRIPQNAKGKPVDNGQHPQTYDLSLHYDTIGITGWDFKLQRSIGVGFDFDSLVNHGPEVGRNAVQLARVIEAAKQLGYTEIRKSTSGTGYHLWVWFDPANLPETVNHTEHSALARAVMQKMSHDTGFNFEADVDCLGSVLWICAKRANQQNGGLSLVHAAKHPLTDWPMDWREQLEVVTRKRRRTRLKGAVSDEEAKWIEQNNRDRPRLPLDEQHREFEQKYQKTRYQGYWNEDHGCFVAHTCGIGEVFEQMKMKGIYKTNSQGTDPNKPNCWMYPLPDGGWRVFRFGSPEEAPTWDSLPSGWKACTVNTTPSFEQIKAAYDGIELPSTTHKGLIFACPSNAEKALTAYGGELGLPAWAQELPTPRPITLRHRKGGGLIAEFDYKTGDECDGKDALALQAGWSRTRGSLWAKMINLDTESRQTSYETIADQMVRQVSFNGKQIGMYVRTSNGEWDQQNTDRIKDNLHSKGFTGVQQRELLGWISDNPFYQVAKPFAGEYPGKREWNLLGSELLFPPAEEVGPTTHWDQILDHIGRGLNEAVEADSWCQEYGIETAADYLRIWIANLIRIPSRRLPMLAMYSWEQNTGKSTLHEGIALLFDERGSTFANDALTNRGRFNGELDGKALCAVEDTDIARNREAYERIKSWVTSEKIAITYKGETTFNTDNYTTGF